MIAALYVEKRAGDGEMSEREEALAAARRMLEPIEPDGSYAVDGFFKDAALVARAMLAASKETER